MLAHTTSFHFNTVQFQCPKLWWTTPGLGSTMFLVVGSALARLLGTFINSSAKKCSILHCPTLCSIWRHITLVFDKDLLYGITKYISLSLAANKHFLKKIGLILYRTEWQQNISFCLSFCCVSSSQPSLWCLCGIASHQLQGCRALYLKWLVSLYFLQECKETDKIVSKIFQR